MELNLPKNPETCPNCYVGRLSKRVKSLAMMAANKPVLIPDFPVWACDVCGAYVYDPEALSRLQLLLASQNQSIGSHPEGKMRIKHQRLNKSAKAKTLDQK